MHKLQHKVWIATATVAVMLLLMAMACAEPIPSKMTTPPPGGQTPSVTRAMDALNASGITAKLKSFGLTDEQVKQRLAQLSPDELTQVTTGAESVAAGGEVPTLSTTVWLLIIIIILILAT
jgi:hypothetical protein